MIEDPVHAQVIVGAFILWGLFAGVVGFFIGKSEGYPAGRADGLDEARREENLQRVLRETPRPRVRNSAAAASRPWWVK